MDALELLRLDLLSPIVLAFELGVLATLVRRDLRFPDALYSALSICLLLAIGREDGVALTSTPPGKPWLPARPREAVGAAAGPAGMARVEPFFVTPFEGALTLFLLEMGW